jgi:hypothetical protein
MRSASFIYNAVYISREPKYWNRVLRYYYRSNLIFDYGFVTAYPISYYTFYRTVTVEW